MHGYKERRLQLAFLTWVLMVCYETMSVLDGTIKISCCCG